MPTHHHTPRHPPPTSRPHQNKLHEAHIFEELPDYWLCHAQDGVTWFSRMVEHTPGIPLVPRPQAAGSSSSGSDSDGASAGDNTKNGPPLKRARHGP